MSRFILRLQHTGAHLVADGASTSSPNGETSMASECPGHQIPDFMSPKSGGSIIRECVLIQVLGHDTMVQY